MVLYLWKKCKQKIGWKKKPHKNNILMHFENYIPMILVGNGKEKPVENASKL